MTQVGFLADNTNGLAISAYVLPNPAIGTFPLSCSVSGFGLTIADIYADVEEYSGVDQTNPARQNSWVTYNGTSDGSSQFHVTVTSATGDMTNTVASFSPNRGLAGTNQTLRTKELGGKDQTWSDDAAGAATVTHTWTLRVPNAAQAIQGGFSICASGASCDPAAPGTPSPQGHRMESPILTLN